ncbi:hypothetical protein V8G54_006016, partial [Vigna mungo]
MSVDWRESYLCALSNLVEPNSILQFTPLSSPNSTLFFCRTVTGPLSFEPYLQRCSLEPSLNLSSLELSSLFEGFSPSCLQHQRISLTKQSQSPNSFVRPPWFCVSLRCAVAFSLFFIPILILMHLSYHIDSLDTLALLGDSQRFATSVEWLGKNLCFDINKTVSVFETTIRVLGGLLSAHLIASDYATVDVVLSWMSLIGTYYRRIRRDSFCFLRVKGMRVPSYDNQLLNLAEDLAWRWLPAFDTPT